MSHDDKSRSTYEPMTSEQIEEARHALHGVKHDLMPLRRSAIDVLCNMAENSLLYGEEIDRLRALPSATAAIPGVMAKRWEISEDGNVVSLYFDTVDNLNAFLRSQREDALSTERGWLPHLRPLLAMKITDEMVDRFLAWNLPKSVLPDLCVMDREYPHRIGTNLLTAEEARQMLEHVLGSSDPINAGSTEREPVTCDYCRANLEHEDHRRACDRTSAPLNAVVEQTYYAWVPNLQEAEQNGDAMVEIRMTAAEGFAPLCASSARKHTT